MYNKKLTVILMLFAFVLTTSYAISEVSATTPDYHGHKWYWEHTDYRYGSMNGFTGLTQSDIYSAIDSARSEVSSSSDYTVNRTTSGTDWITKTFWSDTGKYGHQTPQHSYGYTSGSDIELNYNSNITWYDGTTNTTPNIRVVATHEIFHGADMDHVQSSGTVMFHSYHYSEWGEMSSDDNAKMVGIYGT